MDLPLPKCKNGEDHYFKQIFSPDGGIYLKCKYCGEISIVNEKRNGD